MKKALLLVIVISLALPVSAATDLAPKKTSFWSSLKKVPKFYWIGTGVAVTALTAWLLIKTKKTEQEVAPLAKCDLCWGTATWDQIFSSQCDTCATVCDPACGPLLEPTTCDSCCTCIDEQECQCPSVCDQPVQECTQCCCPCDSFCDMWQTTACDECESFSDCCCSEVDCPTCPCESSCDCPQSSECDPCENPYDYYGN